MSTYRNLPISDISREHFVQTDVLTNDADRFERKHLLLSAMAQTNQDHEEIHLVIKLENGELVDVATNLLDMGEGYVEVRGGYFIPLKAIVNVEL